MLTPSQIRRICRLRRKNVAASDIAKEYSVTRQHISKISKDHLPHLHMKPRLVHGSKVVRKAEILWNQGLSASMIAKKMGPKITKNAVIGLAHRNNFTPRPSPIQRP